jgi:drug/metabolite transporter, DME family
VLSTMAFTAHALALTGALCSAVATIAFRQGLRYSNTSSGLWINLTVGLVCVWIATLLTVPASAMHARALPFFIGSGLLGTVAGRFFRFKGIEKVGAPVAAAINNLLLGERVTLPILLGTCVIVLGTILLSMSGRHVGFRPVHLVYPFLCAFCFGSVAIIRKLGLSHAPPMFGYAINVTTAFIAFTTYLMVSGQFSTVACDGKSLWYFVAAGLGENVGVLFVLIALSLGQVSVVTPLNGTAPLFVLVLAFFFLKDVERLTGRLVLGTVCIVLGVFLLTAV